MTYFAPKVYLKDSSNDPIYKHKNLSFWFRTVIFPYVPFALAFFLVFSQIVVPFYFFTSADEIAKPVQQSVLGYSTGFRSFEFNELQKASGTGFASDPNIPQKFYLTVPKLGIEDALVETNSTDLSPDDFVGHYAGSSLPGENGTSFLYGHSVLPVFYNPKNYKAIFSTLDKLEPGDEIKVSYNNKTYIYKVDETLVLPTEEVDPLGDVGPTLVEDSNLVLMTCWPPGTKIKRLQVNSSLVN